MCYSIGDVAKILNIPSSTLRYYDKVGLLPFVERSSGGIRVFKDSDINWLKLIECLKATNMPIKDIKGFLDWYIEGDSTLERRRNMFNERRMFVEEQISSLQKTLDTLKYKCWVYDFAISAGTGAVLKDIKPEDMPEEIRELKKRLSL